MSNIIDVRMDLPQTAEELVESMALLFLDTDSPGVSNYRRIFGPRWAAFLGTTPEALEKTGKELGPEKFKAMMLEPARSIEVPIKEFEKQMDAAGLDWGLIDDTDNQKTIDGIAKLPGRLKGMAVFNPFQGDEGLLEVERLVKNNQFVAVYANPYKWGIRADDKRFDPVYKLATEMELPVFIYTAMSYRTDLPMDVGRPLYLDPVARRFPKIKIVATCGGWPWVNELVGVARRHPNIHIDTSSHRPKYLAQSGSGFEMLLQFGNTLLQDQMLFGSGNGELGLPLNQIVEEVKALPLKDAVKEKWLVDNAKRLFT